jgi:tRNA modification GTPase
MLSALRPVLASDSCRRSALLTRRLASLTRSPAENETIYALSTPPGRGGVAVVRVSGPEAEAVWRRVLRPVSARNKKWSQGMPRSRVMHRCSVVETDADGTEEMLDDGLAVFFQGAPPLLSTTGSCDDPPSQLPIPSLRSLL